MPYLIQRHAHNLLWVTMQGHLVIEQADAYFREMWQLLDMCPRPTDLLVDGRRIAGAGGGARQRTEQIAHHPHLGQIAFVVSEQHLLLFAPLVKLVSGIGLFGSEHEALDYLRAARGLPPVIDLQLPVPPQRPAECAPAAAPTPPATPAVAAAKPVAPPLSAASPQVAPPCSPGAPGPARPLYSLPRYRALARPVAPATRVLHRLTDMVDGWSDSLRHLANSDYEDGHR